MSISRCISTVPTAASPLALCASVALEGAITKKIGGSTSPNMLTGT